VNGYEAAAGRNWAEVRKLQTQLTRAQLVLIIQRARENDISGDRFNPDPRLAQAMAQEILELWTARGYDR